MAAKMAAFNKAYGTPDVRPTNKGVDPGKLDDATKQFAALGLKRNPHGGIEAERPVMFNGELGLPNDAPAGAVDFMNTIHPALMNLRNLYANCITVSPECLRLEEQIRTCLEFEVMARLPELALSATAPILRTTALHPGRWSLRTVSWIRTPEPG